MDDAKPGFLNFIFSQNKGFTKVTGITCNRKTDQAFREVNFARNKFIVDTILFIMYVAALMGYLLMLKIIGDRLQAYYESPHAYNPNIGLCRLGIDTAILSVYLVGTPVLMKLFRTGAGVRWFIVKFMKADSDDSAVPPANYIEFYNAKMAFQSDGIPRRISNHGGNRTDYELKSNADHTRGLKTASVLYQSVTGGGLLLLAGILMYSRMSTNLALPDFVLINAVAVAAYALSHVFAYHYWKKSQSAEAEDAAQE